MDIFKTISTALAKLIKHKPADPIEKNDILNLIDNNLIVLNIVIETFTANPDVFRYIQTLLKAPDKTNDALQALYTTYVKSLNPTARRLESTDLLKSLYTAAVLTLADHQSLRDNFAAVFNDGTDVGDITLEQLKLTHAVAIGYLNLSALMADWFCYFYTTVLGHPIEGMRVPAYREMVIRDNSAQVADFVSDVLARGTNKPILAVLADVRSTGNVALYTTAASLDTYANIVDYPGIARYAQGFNAIQSILLVREFFANRTHLKYKRNLALREWMLTKTAVLKMDLAKVDPDSPEYQRQLQVLQRYSDLIAGLDKKIASYEAS